MLDLALIIAITGISIYISSSISDNVTWFEYYKGLVGGLFISGIIILIMNKRRKRHELKNRKTIYEVERDKLDL